MKRAEITARVEEAARILRIADLLDRPVSGLSGGDRQRVALGRAIVRRPMAFMMDEPLGALDSELRDVMCGELRALHDRLNATTVYVTHDQTEAMSHGDKIAVMSHGVIEQLATPREIYDRPASIFVADFIGSPPMNLLTFHGALEPGARASASASAEIAVPPRARRLPSASSFSACAPSSALQRAPAARRSFRRRNISARHRSSPSRPRTDGQGAPAVGRQGASRRTRRTRIPAGRSSLFDKATGRAIRTALMMRTREHAHG